MSNGDWSDGNKKLVRGSYGIFVGTAVIIGSFRFGTEVLADGELTLIEATFVGSLVVTGFVAAMPWVFMPALHWMIEAWQARKSK